MYNTKTLNEHEIVGTNKIKIDNYLTFSKNRSTKIMGGVATSIRNDNSDRVVKVWVMMNS